MPSNWLSVDNNFPSFTGKENPVEQIRALHNYLFCLKDELKYTLQNLTADNWNEAALASLTDGAKDALAKQLSSMGNQVSELKQSVEMLNAKVNDLVGLVARVSSLETKDAEILERLAIEEAATAEFAEAITELQTTVADVIQKAEDGSYTLGKTDGKLHLVGEIYLNGVLLSQGGTDETT